MRGASDHGLMLLHETSLSLASHDHVRQIAVGVFTHTKVNTDLNVTATPTFYLYIWNKKFVSILIILKYLFIREIIFMII